MPATEQTWRSMKTMHRLFGISSVAMLIATLWVFAKDQNRPWRTTQTQVVTVDTSMIAWREQQFETDAMIAAHEAVETNRLHVDALPIAPEQFAEFQTAYQKYADSMKALGESPEPADFAEIEGAIEKQKEAAKTAVDSIAAASGVKIAADGASVEYAKFVAEAKKEDDEKVQDLKRKAEAATQAALDAETKASRDSNASAKARASIIESLKSIVGAIRNREEVALGRRKFRSANLDAAKANVDIGVRDNVGDKRLAELQEIVTSITEDLAKLNANYTAKNTGRGELQKIVARMEVEQVAAAKSVESAMADLNRLKKQFVERDQPYFTSTFPFLGKGLVNLPILNAFNPPQKIENLWSEGLLQDYNFKKVRRFDRCTTCHQLLQRSLPGAPNDPAYIHESEVVIWLTPPAAVAGEAKDDAVAKLEATYGLRLAGKGLLKTDDVTVSLVLPDSPAAKALLESDDESAAPRSVDELKTYVAALSEAAESDVSKKILPGLLVGDVIAYVGEDKILSPEKLAANLLEAVGKKPLRLRVRRGLPNPFTSHPRLDLFVGDSSPHKMGTFGCTICHDGQGSATEFKWASHTPNDDAHDPNQSERWARQQGWFDNHHWIYPMYPKRFAESACLKCHHDVTELEPSDRYPEPPAPKVTHGYHLIRKYGCYGCHEVNGFDGPTKRVGPDLRLEPNYFAAAQQLLHLLPSRLSQLEGEAAKATAPEEKAAREAGVKSVREAIELAGHVAGHSHDDKSRNELRAILEASSSAKDGIFSDEAIKLSSSLKDSDTPGDLRKPGPSLRYSGAKLDAQFIYDWTENPKSFRPSTRMPQFFRLWNHLEAEPKGEAVAKEFEPIELHGIVAYLQNESQAFVPLKRPENISSSTVTEKIARGKEQFQTRGCLACHEHQDFPDTAAFRGKTEIVQGPELSRIASKFDAKRNPKGKDWLYSWIKEPSRYHVRTMMPNLFLEPIAMKDVQGKVTGMSDPVEDIVEYLLSVSEEGDHAWKPSEGSGKGHDAEALRKLTLEYLAESRLDQYYENGIPERLRNEIKPAERDLIVAKDGKPTDEQRLRYIGRRTIAKYGCYGCHDIPGFEDAKPIGTGLADWGRKDPAKLAFEHISHYLEHGHGHASHGAKHEAHHDEHAEEEKMPAFYERALHHGNRTGFIFQKLKEPRSYDFRKTENKKYNDRLRMPQFPFGVEEREAVIAFVLGLVADPPTEKYVYKPDPRKAAVLAGKKVIESFNCGGCHVLSAEQWNVSFPPAQFGEQASDGKAFPFLAKKFSPEELAASMKADARGFVKAHLRALPTLSAGESRIELFDREEEDLDDEKTYSLKDVTYRLDLYQPTALAGKPFQTGMQALLVPGVIADRRYPSNGGFLAKYLAPAALQIERRANPQAKGNEVPAWLPPPLIGQGSKVQTAWLHEFLLEPYPIRPAVMLRMPKFNFSPKEASKIVDYFAAVDGVEYPYEYSQSRNKSRLTAENEAYTKKNPGEKSSSARFDAAAKMVTGGVCKDCHLIGDYPATGSERAKGPNLARVYERLRPEYLKRWIANPKAILPYTAMPVNIDFDPESPTLGGTKFANFYHGTSEEQLSALVDLLMNFDEYAKENTDFTELVKKNTPPQPAAGAEPKTVQPETKDEAK